MAMGSNLHWQGTWTKAVYTGGGGSVCKCEAVAILSSTVFYSQILFCRDLFVIGQS